jgi:hypothetical protein
LGYTNGIHLVCKILLGPKCKYEVGTISYLVPSNPIPIIDGERGGGGEGDMFHVMT